MSTASPLRILISTDNHLGYAEKDAVIGEDAFRNFESVLRLAHETEADFLLLGGDLFHEADPSKHTTVRLEKLLTGYCLNDRPVNFTVISPPEEFAEGRVNFENPHLNVGLPVFSIHGNHDYPHGENALSAMDIPSASGLINYFGKKELNEDGNLTLSPILIQKEGVKLALYGLGHIAENRVGTAFRKPGAVTWVPPSEVVDTEDEDWFHIFVLHQNRVQRGYHNANAWIEEKHLKSCQSLDFVLWGHEHQCIQETQRSAVGEFEILQPGSTVATSLAEGESDPKHVFLLELVKKDDDTLQRLTKHRLHSVRPFKFKSIVLSEQLGVYNSSEASVKECVRWEIESMVAECYRQNPEMLPLIRLRIDYSGYDCVRCHDIQKTFADKVANPDTMLLWIKKSKRKERQGQTEKRTPETTEPCLMDELIAAELEGNLKVMSVDACTRAFRSVVLSNSTANVRSIFDENLEQIRSALLKTDAADEGSMRDLIKIIAKDLDTSIPINRSSIRDDNRTDVPQRRQRSPDAIEEERINDSRPVIKIEEPDRRAHTRRRISELIQSRPRGRRINRGR